MTPSPARLREMVGEATQGEVLCFWMQGWENARGPSITHDDPAGGDPRILGEFARVYNPGALEAVCSLVNALPHLLDETDARDRRIAELEADRDQARTLAKAVKSVLPIGDASKPNSVVFPIYVRMSELRALHEIAARLADAADAAREGGAS